jgi:hypothetical protein
MQTIGMIYRRFFSNFVAKSLLRIQKSKHLCGSSTKNNGQMREL